tara:strand:- start:206 stop:502 length:297 start_codon:yes stop_codon:yes gene_type:complete
MMELLVFVAAFFSVLLLGLNSRLMRDNHWLGAAGVSWLITVAQYAMTWAVLHAKLSPESYIFFAGVGGSIGITASHFMYAYWEKYNVTRSLRREATLP